MIVSFTSLDLTVTEGVAMEPTDVCLQSEVSGDVHPLEPDIPFELVFEENTATGMHKIKWMHLLLGN